MFLMDRFFDGAFLTFGLEVIAFAEQDQEDRLDPLIYVFPRMTKCTFHKFGTSGEVEKHDALCLLPLNIVNEKVYIFLWFWFILLSVLSILVILYRIIIVISPKMRAYLLYIRFRLIRREVINTIVKKSYVGDWFLFYMLGKLVCPTTTLVAASMEYGFWTSGTWFGELHYCCCSTCLAWLCLEVSPNHVRHAIGFCGAVSSTE